MHPFERPVRKFRKLFGSGPAQAGDESRRKENSQGLQPLNLSSRLFSKVFWEAMLQPSMRWQEQRMTLMRELGALDDLRASADYNTGSISTSAAWCLYCVTRHFRPARVLEVGTFIGKSTWSMAAAMDHAKISGGEIRTCDKSNGIDIPWQGATRIVQHKHTASSDMMSGLDGCFDLVHLDGRLVEADLPLLGGLLSHETVVALDDFEGIEKGVANLMNLRAAGLLRDHLLIYPCEAAALQALGFSDHAVTAILLPRTLVRFTNQ